MLTDPQILDSTSQPPFAFGHGNGGWNDQKGFFSSMDTDANPVCRRMKVMLLLLLVLLVLLVLVLLLLLLLVLVLVLLLLLLPWRWGSQLLWLQLLWLQWCTLLLRLCLHLGHLVLITFTLVS